MRFLRDEGGEVGLFEDLQTLVIVMVGIVVLLGSTMFNWSAFSDIEEDQELYDEAERLIDAIESWDRLRAVNFYGSDYKDFVLRQPELAALMKNAEQAASMNYTDQFSERIRSDLHYHISFDDLEVDDAAHDPSAGNYSIYRFGDPMLDDHTEAISVKVQYALVRETHIVDEKYDVSERPACLVTVVVWR